MVTAKPEGGVWRGSAAVSLALASVIAVMLAGMAAAGGSLLSVDPRPWRPSLLFHARGSSGGPSARVLPRPHVTSTAAPHATATGLHLPTWLAVTGVILALLAVTLLLGFSAARLLRSSIFRTVAALPAEQAVPAPVGRPAQLLESQVDAAVETLLDENDPRAAVIGSWVRLERAAASAGVTRRPSETSAELVHRVLAGQSVDPQRLHRLNGLYRAARYSPHPVEERDRSAAREALLAIRDQMRAAGPAQREAT